MPKESEELHCSLLTRLVAVTVNCLIGFIARCFCGKRPLMSAESSDPSKPKQAPSLSPPTFAEIVKEVNDAPLMQAAAVSSRFKDLPVLWTANIAAISKTPRGNVRLTLHSPGKPGIILCEVQLKKYGQLLYARKETRVTVLGTIDRASENSVTLKQVELAFD